MILACIAAWILWLIPGRITTPLEIAICFTLAVLFDYGWPLIRRTP